MSSFRSAGTLTFPDGESTPVDQPSHELWAWLSPIFMDEDLTALVTVTAGTPEADVLELQYHALARRYCAAWTMRQKRAGS
ncbi:hypothetical protein HH310_01790 [Actinoplanes sp. TBRC 11911]|uniref:hypothetical protein n=1 Tax=Actinoplanes sp. TBRC 11911 TaxID=2729386 RepID=UPI00145F85C1|nr:hypothetical protein [Actinoplanes sp. TBRC 11911]NMO49929.1 hypothetical protein [Actinoplanes sp. TBRC 11911]